MQTKLAFQLLVTCSLFRFTLTKGLIALFLLSSHFNITTAQSAAYWCADTQIYGVCYQAQSSADAETCAYETCIDKGGIDCQHVLSTSQSGYLALAEGYDGDGNKTIGVALAYGFKFMAEYMAKKSCECKVTKVQSYYDYNYSSSSNSNCPNGGTYTKCDCGCGNGYDPINCPDGCPVCGGDGWYCW